MSHDTAKDRVREQFGAHAESYLHSAPHARGASLAWLLEASAPEPSWRVLDVATGAGHVAFALAPRVAQVVAADLTPEMLALVVREAGTRGLSNLTVAEADAEALPFDAASFDLVTCRIAPHHFGDVPAFLSEAARVLRPGGRLVLVDNVVPEGAAGDYVNAFEKLRDPSHVRCLSLAQWREAIAGAGLLLEREATLDKTMVLAAWAARHDAATRGFLRALLTQARGEAAALLAPEGEGDALRFRLREGLFVARRGA